MVPTFDIPGARELSSAEMQSIVGGDGWLQAIGNAWSAGVSAIGSAITGLFTSSAPAPTSASMNGTLV